MKDKALDFMLPEVLGKPDGFTDKEGNMIFLDEDYEIPHDCYIWFISIEKFDHLKDIKK